MKGEKVSFEDIKKHFLGISKYKLKASLPSALYQIKLLTQPQESFDPHIKCGQGSLFGFELMFCARAKPF